MTPTPWEVRPSPVNWSKPEIMEWKVVGDTTAGPDERILADEITDRDDAYMIASAPALRTALHNLFRAGCHLHEDPNISEGEAHEAAKAWLDARQLLTFLSVEIKATGKDGE